MSHLQANALKLLPSLANQTSQIEHDCQIPNTTSHQLAKAGLYRMLSPAAAEGQLACPLEFVRSLEILSQVDASVAWCVMTGATAGFATAWLAADTCQQLWAGTQCMAGVYAPMGILEPVPGGYELTGRWPYVSGCKNADWIMAGANVINNAAEPPTKQTKSVFFPSSACTILNTWDVMGLRGSGSHDIQVHKLFIATELVCDLQGPARQAGPLFEFPIFGLLAHGISAIATGIAEHALNQALTQVKNSHQQTVLLKCATELQAAQQLRHEVLNSCFEKLVSRQETADVLPPETLSQLRSSATYCTETATKVIDTLWSLAGGHAIYKTTKLERDFRDIHTLTQHIMVSPSSWIVAAKNLP